MMHGADMCTMAIMSKVPSHVAGTALLSLHMMHVADMCTMAIMSKVPFHVAGTTLLSLHMMHVGKHFAPVLALPASPKPFSEHTCPNPWTIALLHTMCINVCKTQ